MERNDVEESLEIGVAEFVAAREREPIRVIDVREPEEHAEGVIAGADLAPLATLPARIGDLDPAMTTVLVCRSGYRSLLAAEYLRDAGFARPRSLAGGMLAWIEAGQPVVEPRVDR